jgi:XTP/dITP diphosphohydrolase
MGVVDALRSECGWTARLTPESLAPYLVEEAAEVSETVREGDLGAPLASELGDILFQILLHARLGEERDDLDLVDVIDALTQKLLRRNTHVFDADGNVLEHPDHDPKAAEEAWQRAKAEERAARVDSQDAADRDPLHGLPRSLPALTLAQKALSRAAAQVPQAPAGPPASGRGDDTASDTADTIGADLLAVVARARVAGVNAESALKDALERSLSSKETSRN